MRYSSQVNRFLSTPSARRATLHRAGHGCKTLISIHALREEGDSLPTINGLVVIVFLSTPSARRATRDYRNREIPYPHFYPRPPRGGRQTVALATPSPSPFLSTPSARRATQPGRSWEPPAKDFYPRPPRGGRLLVLGAEKPPADFYPRPPRGGRHATAFCVAAMT